MLSKATWNNKKTSKITHLCMFDFRFELDLVKREVIVIFKYFHFHKIFIIIIKSYPNLILLYQFYMYPYSFNNNIKNTKIPINFFMNIMKKIYYNILYE